MTQQHLLHERDIPQGPHCIDRTEDYLAGTALLFVLASITFFVRKFGRRKNNAPKIVRETSKTYLPK